MKNPLFSRVSGLFVTSAVSIALLACSGGEGNDVSSGLAASQDAGGGGVDGAVGGADTSGPTGDVAGSPDAGSSSGGNQVAAEPKGHVYEHDPITDKGNTKIVTLTKPISDDGTLKSNWVEIRNCLNEDGGPAIKYGGFEAGNFCVEKRIAKPGADGHYSHIIPPKDTSDPNDPFAEVQMYHHVNQMHDYFKGTHGLTDVDFPIHALINVQFKLSPLAAAATGQKPGWSGMPNAAFMPPEAFKQLPLPPRDTGAIVFFQWQDTDFSYDASVIYHEYTHAMIGTTRLQGAGLSLFGMDSWPGAMNEGFADYFAASMKSFPVIGAHALAVVASYLKRDLSVKKKCPDDMTTEIHADGKIIGSALWAVREKLGKVETDAIVLAALQSFTKATKLDGAMKLILAEADKKGKKAVVKAVLDDFGVIGCVPAKEWKEWTYLNSPDLLPYTVEGVQGGGPQPKDGMPGYVQFWFDAPVGTHAVELSFEAKGQGGFGGGGQPNIQLAARKKDPVTVSVFDGSALADTMVAVKSNPSKAQIRTVTLTGACLPQKSDKVYTLMFNKGGKAQVTWLGIKVKKAGDTLINPHNCSK